MPRDQQTSQSTSPHTLRVAVAEMVGVLQDVDANLKFACQLSEEAAGQQARVVLFPEGCLTGNALTDPRKQAVLPVSPEPFASLQGIADARDLTICIGFTTDFKQFSNDAKFNVVHAVIRPKQSILFQRKCYKAKTEPSFLAPWPDQTRVLFEVDGVRTAIMICSEAWCPAIVNAVSAAGVKLVLRPTAGCLKPEEVIHDWPPKESSLTQAITGFRKSLDEGLQDARRTRLPRVVANPLGFDGEVYWPGNGYFASADGSVLNWVQGSAIPSQMNPHVVTTNVPLP